jgi:hypothetical protein
MCEDMRVNPPSSPVLRPPLPHLRRTVAVLDDGLRVPGTSFRFGLDPILGLVPILGDLFDAAWKANRRNPTLLERHVDAPEHATRADRRFLWLVLCVTLAGAGVLIGVATIRW